MNNININCNILYYKLMLIYNLYVILYDSPRAQKKRFSRMSELLYSIQWKWIGTRQYKCIIKVVHPIQDLNSNTFEVIWSISFSTRFKKKFIENFA